MAMIFAGEALLTWLFIFAVLIAPGMVTSQKLGIFLSLSFNVWSLPFASFMSRSHHIWPTAFGMVYVLTGIKIKIRGGGN
uniref:Uncharacterized protein n=1 Tax=Salix viminalis TaxID=40686 RepID=A0A6N2K2H5_SALVM